MDVEAAEAMLLELAIDWFDSLATEAHDLRTDVVHPSLVRSDEFLHVRRLGNAVSIAGYGLGGLGNGGRIVPTGCGRGLDEELHTATLRFGAALLELAS